MEHQSGFDEQEFGSSTGDLRENDPSLPGFTSEDPLFRSHFEHANRLADRSYEEFRPAYQLGFDAAVDLRYAGKSFDEAEKDLEGNWLNVRFAGDEWQSVRTYAREGFEHARRIGFISGAPPAGGGPSHQLPSFADPVADDIDPTSPESPENTGDR